MLDEKNIQIVKSTAPILEENGEALTRHFYKRMFSHNPEVAPFFNPTHQQTGSQQKALAAALCAYAANIDNLEVLGNAVELITQKHVSLLIKPEHYPIVGTNLIASIKELLGDAATDEVIEAWEQAYAFLAHILIGRETQIYQEQATLHGWKGFKPFQVIRTEKESSIITSFYLSPIDGNSLPPYKPGQYITVRVPGPKGYTTMRNYSLSDKSEPLYFRISVKREIDAEGTYQGYVSNMLHDQIDVGDILEIAPPCGEFYLDIKATHDRPLVLLAAGIGITPIFSILKTAIETMPHRQIILIHACLNEKVQAFRKTIDALAIKHKNLTVHHCYSEPPAPHISRSESDSTGLIDGALIESFIPQRDADYYFCGPKAFMINIYHQLLEWGVPATQVHFEFFGPRQELTAMS